MHSQLPVLSHDYIKTKLTFVAIALFDRNRNRSFGDTNGGCAGRAQESRLRNVQDSFISGHYFSVRDGALVSLYLTNKYRNLEYI